MTRVAAIDCGTNSLRLLIADVDTDRGVLRDVDRRMEVVRLGEGVDRTGRISEAALRRTLEATDRYATLCRERDVERIRFVATSASRDAQNREEFITGVTDLVGVPPEVIDGTQEARLSFDGATRGLAEGYPAPYLVVDIGGGSTEFVLGEAGRILASRSVDIGCVRLTERHVPDELGDGEARTGRGLTGEPLADALRDIEAAVTSVAQDVPLSEVGTLIGLAGSVTTVTAHALRLPEYDAEAVHGTELSVTDVMAACDDLVARSRADLTALPYLHPGRVDVIGMGSLIWRQVIDRVAKQARITRVLTSEHDILDGIAWSLA
jgi:exopolyphosphatase / guanosine-5'-triphosphate,3'-diphosphate pyrophosphatase